MSYIKDKKNIRKLRISNLIRILIIECIRKGKGIHPILHSLPLTFTLIEVNICLTLVKCFFYPFNTSLNHKDIFKALQYSKYKIHKFIIQEIKLKHAIELRFIYDTKFQIIYNKIQN